MYRGTFKSLIAVNASNIPGWRTNRKIVVIESDDWGSIRMPSGKVFDALLQAGIPVNTSHYTLYDSLESNADLEMLMETLTKFKDSTGRPPMITGVNIVANPDFEKIAAANFTEYFYEPFTETCRRYSQHNNVYALWKEGIEKRLLVPVFHGREHLNVKRWMHALHTGHKSTLKAFEHQITGIPRHGIDREMVPNFQAAFDIDTPDDLPYLKIVLETGLDVFEKLYGYRSRYFVPTNGPFNNTLEEDLRLGGVDYINTAKIQKEPIGNGKYQTHVRFLGQKNRYGQRYLTRNCFFEPASSGFEWPKNIDWVSNCLKEIEIAFWWHKPAVISSHRVNYIGYLHPENRDKSLKLLSELLTKMLKRWPDIEFMTSVELGDVISKR
jgi:hypothetical protein